ncbi:hypothetical protein CAPTEDRAFT_211350 [Capitella teleta]|uniref:Iodothyronine deiodinase n=1 Tax=Capitella teleta TaxID=283909 RepID=R7TN49_CAPTE|nr:hypothetical protein CAPTEDRAFT_211350 [Capitella teleta]|eukprot:ELT92505.1 hypothetical protein CAPTEDRAFT_211350 [Capitella teleta]
MAASIWKGLSAEYRLKTVHKEMKRFCRVAEELTEQADFLAVYIEEAHPDDGFSFSYKSGFEVMQAKVLKERVASAKVAAENLEGKLKFPVVVDSMQNDAMYAYGARPERLYIVRDGRVVYQSNRGPYYMHFEEFESELRAMVKMQ